MSAPDDREIDDISAVEECLSCGWSPAAVILVAGDWQCYNCGSDPHDDQLVTDGGRAQSNAGVTHCPEPDCGIPFPKQEEVITHLQWDHNLSELEAYRRVARAE